MKNQGVWITRIVSLAVCVFVIAYMGYHVLSSFNTPLKTVTAVLTSTAETLPFNGVIVRDEEVLPLPTGLLDFTVGDGERVSKGQTIAVAFRSEVSRQNNLLMKEKTVKRDLLTYIANHSGGVTDSAALDADLRSRTAGLLSAVAAGDLSSLPQQSIEIKALLFRQAYSFEGISILTPQIDRLNEEIDALAASIAADSTAIRSDKPGLFSPLNDGLEAVWTPEALNGITVSAYQELEERRSLPPDESKGRLILGWTWHLSFLMPSYEAKTLRDSVTVRFADGFACSMKKASVSPEENGQCVVTLSSDRYVNRVISERRLQGELIYSEHEGVRIPADGLRFDSETGGYYVFCLVLGRVVRKDVTLNSTIERDNYFLAEYFPETSKAILPGDEVIIAGKDLYDGKIISKN